MDLFGLSRFLDRDIEEWQLATWEWLMRHLGGVARLKQTPLVTPTRDFFPPTDLKGHERAEHTFNYVKAAMGMEAWSCDLIAKERAPQGAQVAEFVMLQSRGAADGTFSVDKGRVTISYASDLVANPHQLVSTLAHELAHYLLASVTEAPPGGWELHELATDLTVAYAGFGVFGANTAFHFQQFQDAGRQGWRSQRRGYLSEESWALALAVFLALSERRGSADTWLKGDVRNLVGKADRYLARRPERLAPLLAID